MTARGHVAEGRAQSDSCKTFKTNFDHLVIKMRQRARSDINRMMVRYGYAVTYRAFAKRYVPDEQAAKAAKNDIWRGSMFTPACFRHDSIAGCPCPIDSCVYQGK